MSRFSANPSHGHRCIFHYGGYYLLIWEVDRYYQGSRHRWPQKYERQADEAGARRFCKRWRLVFHPGIGDDRARQRQARPASPTPERS